MAYTNVKEGLSVNPATFHSHAKNGVQECRAGTHLRRKSSDMDSFCYIRTKDKPTQYYAARTTFPFPPLEFLGDKEERQILQWFITHKGEFLQEQYTISNLQQKHLSDAELKEVEACSDVFKQQQDHDEELSAQVNVVELPSLSLRFNSLAF